MDAQPPVPDPKTTLPVPSTRPQIRPQIRPLDPPMVPFALGGMAAWALAGLVLLPFHGRLAAHGHGSWLWICLAGFLIGIAGLLTMLRHDADRRRRRAAAGQA